MAPSLAYGPALHAIARFSSAFPLLRFSPSLSLTRSVRGRLTLLILAIIVPGLALAALYIFQAYRHEHEVVAARLLSTARAIADVVDGEINEAHILLKALGSTSVLARGDLAGLDAVARGALTGDERWFVLLDAKGQQVVNTRVPLASPLPLFQREPEFAAAMERGEPYVSDLIHGPVAQAMVTHVSHAYRENGRFKYSLSVGILPATLGKVLNVDRYAPGCIVAILDRQGVLVARNRSPEKFVGGPAMPDIVQATAARAEGIVDSVTLENIPVLTAFSRARCGWSVAIGAPTEQLYASARWLLLWGVICAALLTLIAVWMAAWIGRAVVENIDALTRDADSIGRGAMPAVRASGLAETDFVAAAMRRTADALLQRTRTLEAMNRVNTKLVAEHDLEKIVQSVTDAGREVSGAAFGAFFYNVEKADGESYMLFTLSGAPREAFEKFGMPRNTPVFAHTFAGTGVVRVGDITQDARYGKMGPHHGMPKGHLPVRSYLAVPVMSRSGEVIGGLFFGHPEPEVFTAEAERVVVGLAAEAAIAIDNAKLYRAVSQELAAKSKAEAELRKAHLELEQKVVERTASLREAITQMEEFSYTVSHDLRGPLRAMNSYAVALLEDCGDQLDATAKEYVDRIQRASARMDQLTRDVLSYSRVARDQVSLVPTDIGRMVHALVEHYAELQPAVADVHVEAPLHPVLAHEPSLRQCLANLMTNAVKFVRPGEKPRVSVRTEKTGDRVRIWIEDNGIGIPPKHHAALFRIFERLPTEGKYEGTGVGLAIVRKAAEKMGGTCGVESDGTNGSRFWIELAAGAA